MKRTAKYISGFALLGALTGAGMALLLGGGPAGTHGLPYWLDDHFNPVVVVMFRTIPCGVFFGALTGLAAAFSSGRFACVRCLLAIAVPVVIATAIVAPRTRPNMYAPPWPMWAVDVVVAVVAVVMAVLLVYLGHCRMRKTGQRKEGLVAGTHDH